MIKPIRDFVLVKPEDPLTITKGGIHIPDTVKQKTKKGTVIATGPSCELPISGGARIYFEADSGYPLNYYGEKFIILRPASIWALIEETEHE